MKLEPTHAGLINAGVKWLKKPYHNTLPTGHSACGVILTELVSFAREIPDVLGFSSETVVLIEVKVSRADFLADANKPWRKTTEAGMGDLRYYLVPAGLVAPEEVPATWGLLEFCDGQIIVTLEPQRQAVKNWRGEQRILYSHARRLATPSRAPTKAVSLAH